MLKMLFFIFTLLLSSLAFSQETAIVKLIVKTVELPSNRAVFIRGNHQFLGHWQTGKVRLQRLSANDWTGIFILKKGDKLSALFDLGDQKMLALEGHNPKDTSYLEITGNSEINIEITGFKGLDEPEEVRAVYHNFTNTVPNGLRDRKVVVRVPPGYEDDTLTQYPVIYFQHGTEVFEDDPNMKGVEWRMDEILDSLVKDSIIEPCIVVSIHSLDQSQKSEYADEEIGRRYRTYLSQNLHPLMASRFRISPDNKDHILMGFGASGFAGFLTAWEYPEVFGKVSCMSTPFKIFDNDIFKILDEYQGPTKDLELYLDIGEFGYDERYKPGFDEVVAYLSDHEYSFKTHFEENSIQSVEHFRARLWRPIVQFLGYPE